MYNPLNEILYRIPLECAATQDEARDAGGADFAERLRELPEREPREGEDDRASEHVDGHGQEGWLSESMWMALRCTKHYPRRDISLILLCMYHKLS